MPHPQNEEKEKKETPVTLELSKLEMMQLTKALGVAIDQYKAEDQTYREKHGIKDGEKSKTDFMKNNADDWQKIWIKIQKSL